MAKQITKEIVEGYLLKNSKGKFLNDKLNWTDYNLRTIEFSSLSECMKVKSQRPSSRVVEVSYRYTTTIGYGLTKTERVERPIKKTIS